MTRFEVLGPLRVWRGEDELDLGFPQQRALLALLLLHTGRLVPLHEIVDVLWPEHPPASAMNVVRRYAGALRRLLEPGLPPRAAGRRLPRRGGGYLLEAEQDEVDLSRFRDHTRQGKRAVATGRAETAVHHFGAALALWRGPVAMGIPASARTHLQFAGVERELVGTSQMAADAALLCGRTAEVLPALRRAASLDPLNEPLHARIVLSLEACGLRAEALDAYEDTRRRLAEELGVTPGPELAAAHTRLLHPRAGARTSAPGRRAAERAKEEVPTGRQVDRVAPLGPHTAFIRPAQLPPDLAVFSGRGQELGDLTALADATATAAGTHATVTISGMAGIGKTTLAVHWAHEAADRFPDGQLHVGLGGFAPGKPRLEPAQALRGMLSALGVPAARQPGGLDALVGLYRTVLTGRRVLVLLDDAVDVEQVRPLLPASPGSLTLVTSRNGLPALYATGARPLRLEVPDAAEARALLARRIGVARLAAEPRAADEIVARCGHLPVALAVVAARAVSRPHFPLAAVAAELRDVEGSLDTLAGAGGATDARAAFLRSYRLLSPESARLFRLMSLHSGADIEAGAAAALAGLRIGRARLCLVELAVAHLVTASGPGRYALHGLLRVFAAELTEAQDSAAESRAACRRLSDFLARTGDNGGRAA